MFRIKKIMIMAFLISVLAAPTAAFASTGPYSGQTSYSWFKNLVYSFSHKDPDYQDYIKYIQWYQSWKDQAPNEESIDIWRRWYCGN